MARNKGVAKFAVNFEPTGQSPLDARTFVPTKADLLTAYPNKNYHKRMKVTCEDTGEEWQLVDINKATAADFSGWRRVDIGAAEKTAVVNSLDSESTTEALSAKQGKMLKGDIDTLKGNFDTFKGEKGNSGGLATLDESGKVPAAQLPSYVDDVLEYATKADFPSSESGEAVSGKIYVDISTGKTYRWGGTAYVEISESLALGETSSTAYSGDKGKKNAADIADLVKRVEKVEGVTVVLEVEDL